MNNIITDKAIKVTKMIFAYSMISCAGSATMNMNDYTLKSYSENEIIEQEKSTNKPILTRNNCEVSLLQDIKQNWTATVKDAFFPEISYGEVPVISPDIKVEEFLGMGDEFQKLNIEFIPNLEGKNDIGAFVLIGEKKLNGGGRKKRRSRRSNNSSSSGSSTTYVTQTITKYVYVTDETALNKLRGEFKDFKELKKDEIDGLQKQISDLQKSKDNTEKDLTDLKKVNEQTEAKLTNLQEQYSLLQSQYDNMVQMYEKAEAEAAEWRQKYFDAQEENKQQLKELQATHAQAIADLQKSMTQENEKQIEELKLAHQKEVDDLKKRNEELTGNINQMTQQINDLVLQNKDSQETIKKLEKANEKLVKDFDKLLKINEALQSQIADLNSNIADLKQENAEIKSELQENSSKLNDCNGKLDETLSKLELLVKLMNIDPAGFDKPSTGTGGEL